MTTRFYFQNELPADLFVPVLGPWNLLAASSYWALTTEKDATDILTNGSNIGPFGPSQLAVDRVYVSRRLGGPQLLGGTVSLYLQTLESNADDDITTAIEIFVVDQNGALRGILLPAGHYGSSTEYAVGTYTNRAYLLDTPLAPVTALPGDRLIIVIGHGSGIGAVSSNASARFGSDINLDDLSSNETQTSSGIGFSLFSQDIDFEPPPFTGGDDGGHGCLEDPAAPPDPTVPPTEPPPPVPVYLKVPVEYPPNAIPHEGIDEILHLIRVDGNTTDGFTYKVHKVISPDYHELEWWYHRKGGCGTFRLLSRDQNILADFADRTAYAWELWVRIRLPNEPTYTTWYRGEIKSVVNEHAGSEMLADIRGIGYIEQLQSMYISRIFPAGMTVKEILDSILTEYVYPGTRITPASLVDITNLGLTDSGYELRGDVHFECSVWRALKYLAELQGDIEWGVDASSRFYWKHEVTTPGQAFFLSNDSVYTRAGAYNNDLTTKVRVEGKLDSEKELLRIIKDVTDPTDFIQKQEYSLVSEQPWIGHAVDAQHWADNILQIRRRMAHWRLVKWGEVKSRLEANHPFSGLRRVLYRDSVDVTNDFSEYEIAKIHYRKGSVIKTKVHEKGRTPGANITPQTTLSAEVWLGNPPRTVGEDLNRMQADIDALKGKWKQYRNPGDVTSSDFTPQTRGAVRFFTFDATIPQDVTLKEIINFPSGQIDPTLKIGIPIYFNGEEWVKQGIRRTVYELPDKGLYVGEIITKITDITNNTGDIFKWSGTEWQEVTPASAVPDVLQLTEQGSTPSTPPTSDWKLYFTPRGPAFLEDNGDVFELEDYPQGRRGWTVFEEFLQHNFQVAGGSHSSKEGWNRVVNGAGATVVKIRIDNNHPGVVRLDTGTAITGRATLHLDFDGQTFGGGRVLYECMLRVPILPTLTEDFKVWAGYGDNSGPGAPTDGLGLSIDRILSNTDWLRYAHKAGVGTINPSGAAFTTAWVKLGFLVNAAGTSVEYFVDDVSVGTETTNIPINAAEESGLWLKIEKVAGGTARTIEVDYVRCRQWLTNPR